jgi:hypothetical protein
MNANDQILAEIRKRWKHDIEFLEKCEKDFKGAGVLKTATFDYMTSPAKDIRYLLGRLEAAEKAARGTAKLNTKLNAYAQKVLGLL